MTIALIGAGAAGAACVSVLRSRGADFCIFEKSRGVGGRMCTRRVSEIIPEQSLFFDHGCPSFELTDRLREELSHLIGPNTLKKLNDSEWVSSPSMPQLIKDLLSSTQVRTQSEISAVTGTPGQWFLTEKQKNEHEAPISHGPFQKVILTAPAPQVLNLLRTLQHDWASPLKNICYSSRWMLLATLRSHPPTHPSSTNIFSSIRCQDTLPSRPKLDSLSSWVSSAHEEWSRSHLELETSEVHTLLLQEFCATLGISHTEVLYSTAHRWRYAQVTNALALPFLHDSNQSLFYASDACLGNGVAGALTAGFEVGRFVCDSLN